MDSDPLVETVERLRRHPNFDQAASHYVDVMLQWQERPILLNKLFSSHMRAQMVGFVLYLHFTANPGDAETGPTFQNILRLCEARKEGSPRAVKTLLGLLRIAGFIQLTKAASDRRVRYYTPTPKMLGFSRHWYTHAMSCYDVLEPGHNFSDRVVMDPEFLPWIFKTAGRRYVEDDIQIAAYYPMMFKLLSYEGGFAVAASLLRARQAGASPVSVKHLDGKYSASLSQRRNVLRYLEAMQLISLRPGGVIDVHNELHELFYNYIAREMALYVKYALFPAEPPEHDDFTPRAPLQRAEARPPN